MIYRQGLVCRPCRSLCRRRLSAAACAAAAAAGSGRSADASAHHSLCVRPAGGRLLRVISRLLPHRFPNGSAAAAMCPYRSCRKRRSHVRWLCPANVRPQGRQQPRGGFAMHLTLATFPAEASSLGAFTRDSAM